MENNQTYGKVTEETLEKLRARMGREFPLNEPHIRSVNFDNIRHVARGVGDANPLYTDPEYAKTTRYGRLVAPPALLYAAGWGSWDLRRGQGLPGVHAYHSGDHFFYYRPFLEGDEIHGTKELLSIEHKPGRYAGQEQWVQTTEIKYYNQNNELCALDYMPVFRAERGSSKKIGRDRDIKRAFYTPEEIAKIDEMIGAEQVRGAQTRWWEDVTVGEAVPAYVRGPLCVHDIICWLTGVGSAGFIRSGQYWLDYRRHTPKAAVASPQTGAMEPVERVHYDGFMASEVGQPAPYDYGSQRGGWATNFVSDWTGDDGWMAEVEFEFRGFMYHGDYIVISGTVTDKWIGAKTGTGYVEMEFSSVDQRGRNIMPGRAVVALPSHKNGQLEFPVDVAADGRAQ